MLVRSKIETQDFDKKKKRKIHRQRNLEDSKGSYAFAKGSKIPIGW